MRPSRTFECARAVCRNARAMNLHALPDFRCVHYTIIFTFRGNCSKEFLPSSLFCLLFELFLFRLTLLFLWGRFVK